MTHWHESVRAAVWVALWGVLLAWALGEPGWLVLGLLGAFLALVTWPRGE